MVNSFGKKNKTNVGIVGLGLIGGSIAMALKDFYNIIGIDNNPETTDYALNNGIIDSTGEFTCLKTCEIIFICVPVFLTREIADKIYDCVGDSAIITDVASVKGILKGAKGRIVGGHPMAGTEFSGISAAKHGLFKNAYYCITPYEKTSEKDIMIIKNIAVGILKSKPIILDCDYHDKLVGLISHLPHTIAYTLSHCALGEQTEIAGCGFMDTTRIASSDPRFWTEVARLNKNNVLSAMQKFINDYEKLFNMIQSDDFAGVQEFFEKAKTHRDSLLSSRKVNEDDSQVSGR